MSRFTIWHEAWCGSKKQAECSSIEEVREWFEKHPDAHSAYYSVTGAEVPREQWRRKDEE